MKRMYMPFILCILCGTFVIFTGTARSDENEGPGANDEARAKVLVVVYSYTGNTRAAADEIIEWFKADTVIIRAERYDGFGGGMKASKDAWTEVKTTSIEPETVDMGRYDLIFLGSPIWWFRPAVPLWTFVDKNNFKGGKIVLFNTFSSKFKSKYIDEFIELVETRGGQFLDHIYVRRGRWYAQLNREELLEQFNEILDVKEAEYKGVISKGH